MLREHNSVVNLYRICLTPPPIFTSLPSNMTGRMGALALAIGVAACAMMDSRPASEIVKERAELRAKAQITGDTRQMYDLFSPAVRKTLKYEDYASNTKTGFWKAATVDKVECPTNELCDVSLSVEYVLKGARIKSPLRQTWIREGHDWWYAVKD